MTAGFEGRYFCGKCQKMVRAKTHRCPHGAAQPQPPARSTLQGPPPVAPEPPVAHPPLARGRATIVVDSSWRDGRAGAGMVFTGHDGREDARASSFAARGSYEAEHEGIRLAIEWLIDLGESRGVVLCDCQGAVLDWQGQLRDDGGLHEVHFIRDHERDARYHRAHRLGARARTASEGTPLSGLPRAKGAKDLPRGITEEQTPRRVMVVMDDVATLDEFAERFQLLPSDVTGGVYGVTVAGGQAIFMVTLGPADRGFLVDALRIVGISARVYVQT